jgi:hypothetical protein
MSFIVPGPQFGHCSAPQVRLRLIRLGYPRYPRPVRGAQDEWSLTMSRYADGSENQNIPRILIKPIDSKKAFIKLAKPWKPDEWKDNGRGHFLDLRTLAWALFNRSYSLKRLCEELKTEHQKIDHEPTGELTVEEIEYARQDGRCIRIQHRRKTLCVIRENKGIEYHNY